MAGITLAESLSYTVKDLSDQQTGDVHLRGNERGFQPQTTNRLRSSLWTQLIQFRTKVMSGLCTKSWLLRSLLLHRSLCSHRGRRLGRAFTTAEVSRGEGSKKSWTKPCQPRRRQAGIQTLPLGPAMLCYLQISVLPCKRENVRRGTRGIAMTKNPQRVFLGRRGWRGSTATV